MLSTCHNHDTTSTHTTTTPVTSSLPLLDNEFGWPLLDGTFDDASAGAGFNLLDAATEQSIAAAVEQALSESPPTSVTSMDTPYSSAAVTAAMASTASAAADATSYSLLPLPFQQQYQQLYAAYTPLTSSTTASSGNDVGSAMSTPAHAQLQQRVKGRPGRKRSHDPSDDDPDVVLKRARNNVAAKKYRQKKIDRISELETEVAEVKTERDELRVQLARFEAETTALRELLKLAQSGSGSGVKAG